MVAGSKLVWRNLSKLPLICRQIRCTGVLGGMQKTKYYKGHRACMQMMTEAGSQARTQRRMKLLNLHSNIHTEIYSVLPCVQKTSIEAERKRK